MSLQDASSLFNYQSNQQNDPIARGLSAGEKAYSRTGLSDIVSNDMYKSQQQRNVLGLNAQAQREGAFPVSGTSAAAYQYLHGQGDYPYKASTQGPTSIDYEKAHGITGSKSQASLAQEAKDSPWRGSSTSNVQPRVNTAVPGGGGLMGSLMSMMPMYLGYKYLVPEGAKQAIADATELDFLGPSASTSTAGAGAGAGAGATAAQSFGSDAGSQAYYDYNYAPTNSQYGAFGEAPLDAPTSTQYGAFGEPPTPTYTEPPAPEYNYAPTNTEYGAMGEPPLDAPTSTQYGAFGEPPLASTAPGLEASTVEASAPAYNAQAVADMETASQAEAAANYEATVGATETAVSDAALADAGTEVATEEAAAMSGADMAALTAEYGPYIAAAIIADQLLNDGRGMESITGALKDVGDFVGGAVNDVGNFIGDAAQGIGDVVGGAAQGIGDAVSGIVSGAGDVVSSAWDTVTGGCFLTTAAVEHMGQPDDGRVLTAFRTFRDKYMMETPERRREIEWYYRKAPKIVEALSKNPKQNAIYREMYNNYIIPTYKAIKSGDMEHAHQEYTKMIGFAKKVSGLSSKELAMGKSQGIPKNISKNFKGGGQAEDELATPQIADTNKFGQLLDKVVDSQYQRAQQRNDVKATRAYKDEMDYRKRMKGYQQNFAAGGISGQGVMDLHVPLSIGGQQGTGLGAAATTYPGTNTYSGPQQTGLMAPATPTGAVPQVAYNPTFSNMERDYWEQQASQPRDANGKVINQPSGPLQGQALALSNILRGLPTAPQSVPMQQATFAGGGLSSAAFNLGGYSDGGRLLRGPGDGVSDSIPASIGHNKQPARLADGEFVVPARIVSELGNGSTEAGARKLYAMMDRIQADRKKSVGKGKVAVNSRADKHLPA